MCVKLLVQNLNNLVCFTIILNSLIRIIFYLVIILIVIILINLIAIVFIFFALIRLTVGSDFGSNYWNRPDPTVSILEIDSKPELVCANLKSIRLDSSRFSISILEIESNCQEIENNVIMSRYTKNSIK